MTIPDDHPTALAPDQRRPPTWRARTLAELVSDQLAGLDAWHRSRAAGEEAQAAPMPSREARLDADRRQEARRREQEALLARAQAQLLDTSGSLGSEQPRVLLAHRNDWLRGKVAERLQELGAEVVGSVTDGADAVAAVVLDQPDVVLLEDRMAHLSGAEVVLRARQLAPCTLPAVQVSSPAAVDALVAAGARAVFSRRVPPAEVADALVACLLDQQDVVRLL